MLVSYHASHEQFDPAELLALAVKAEQVGFDAVFSSDHLQPWGPRQGESGFAWSWLGAAMQATRRCPFGVITVPSGWRYQPVVLAQAIATLGLMFPKRLRWVAFGSGEAINECAVGADWPHKDERNARLKEGAEIVRALLAGAKLTHRGRVQAVNAKLWSRPDEPAQIVGAATTERTAAWLATWADGLLTTCNDIEQLKRIVQAFRDAGGAEKPVHVKLDVSWAESEESALLQAHEQWRYNMLGGGSNWDISDPSHFERAARFIRPEDVRQAVFVAADLDEHAARLREIRKLGVATLDVHNVGRNQTEFIDAFGRHVLPQLARTLRGAMVTRGKDDRDLPLRTRSYVSSRSTSDSAWDVVIVGAGPAGMSAALILARACRRVLLCDSGTPRSWASKEMHGFLTREGISPSEFRELAHHELKQFANLEFLSGEVSRAQRRSDGFFAVKMGRRSLKCRKLLIATGVFDHLPPIDGIEPLFGTSAFQCPYCDGWEVRGESVAVYGKHRRGLEIARAMTAWTEDILLCSDGRSRLDREERAALKRNGIELVEEPIARLVGRDGRLQHIVFRSGRKEARTALFFDMPTSSQSSLAESLGCEFTPKGGVRCGQHEATSVPGVFVAGNIIKDVQLAIVAAAEGARAAFGINRALTREDFERKGTGTRRTGRPSRSR